MKKLILNFFALLIAITAYSQTEKTQSFNFDFENVEGERPVGWNIFGGAGYKLATDQTIVKKGKYSVSIEHQEGTPGFKAWAFTIPNNYAGRKITLTGYIKTENVTDGYAGLWMRIDPSIAFNNMSENGIKGTTDWKKYEITLVMNPERTTQIVLGGLLVGKGKMWLDDLEVTIDGRDIQGLKPFERKLFPADKDKEFDNGSLVENIPVDKNQIENLKALGLIWGFLKYYHPTIAKGEYNWDYELMRVLPKVMATKNNNERDEVIISWINKLGEFSESKKEPKLTEVKILPDLEWITASKFSTELTSLLLRVKNASRSEEHYYIDLAKQVNNPVFKNEKAYGSQKYPDAGFRLLALYRHWSIIQYYFPYKNLIEEDWKNVLEEFIPKVVSATNETEYMLTMLELIARVHDTHANIWDGSAALKNYFGLRYSAVELTFIENKPVVTGFHDEKLGKETGLKIGDVITVINSKPFDQIIKDKLKYTPASNYPTQLRDIAPNLLRTNEPTIAIEFDRDGKTESLTLKTFPSDEIKVRGKYQSKDTCFKFINKDIAYINNGSLKRAYLPKIWDEMKNAKGLIIDIRNYPSDFPIYDLSNYLMPNSAPFASKTIGSLQNPGLFVFAKELNTGSANKNYYKGKVVILINELSQSSAEFHAMAYRVNPNATVIGSTTAAADGNVSQFFLPGGISTMISGIGIYYPDGKETQRVGIIPDIELRPTIQGIKEGRDELMEKAISLINGK